MGASALQCLPGMFPGGSARGPLLPALHRLLTRLLLLAPLLALVAGIVGWTPDARAQFQRNLPANGVLGVVTGDPTLPLPMVRIDSRLFRMAPGGIIVDQNNRTLLHAQIPQRATAYIIFDANSGDVQRMFLLTPDELQRLRAR